MFFNSNKIENTCVSTNLFLSKFSIKKIPLWFNFFIVQRKIKFFVRLLFSKKYWSKTIIAKRRIFFLLRKIRENRVCSFLYREKLISIFCESFFCDFLSRDLFDFIQRFQQEEKSSWFLKDFFILFSMWFSWIKFLHIVH